MEGKEEKGMHGEAFRGRGRGRELKRENGKDKEEKKEEELRRSVEKGWGGQEDDKINQWSTNVLGKTEERGRE